MLTKLKIKANFMYDDDLNYKLKDLIQDITEKDLTVEFITNEHYDMSSPVYSIDYTDHSELKSAIRKFNDHRYIPFDGYEELQANDFVLSLESDNINESFEYLSQANLTYIEEQLNMLDHIASDVVCEQEDLKEKVDALYSFMQKSGVMHYKQLIEGLLDVMDQHGLVNKEKLKEQMFAKLH